MGRTIISEDRRFEWDEEKDILNKIYHGLSFNEVLPAIVLYLSYTEKATGRTRIISARPAVPSEEKMYYEWRENFIT